MKDDLKDFFRKVAQSSRDIHQLLKKSKTIIHYKGYGTPKEEMEFLHQAFLLIQEEYPDFQSFSWVQHSSYNDNYFYFKLEDFMLNGRIDIEEDFGFFSYPEDGKEIIANVTLHDDMCAEEINYAKKNHLPYTENGLLNTDDYDKFTNYFEEKYHHLKTPIIQFLSLIKLLEIHQSMYYFLYTFGNEVKVDFCTEGVRITQVPFEG